MAAPEFQDFFASFGNGEAESPEEMLPRMAPFLRQIIRLYLIDQRLRRSLDTMDILQSLLKDFLVQTQHHRPEAETSGGLCAYLAKAVQNKIRTKLRNKKSPYAESLPEHWDAPSAEPPPLRHLEAEDLRQVVRARLCPHEQLLFDLRVRGYSWDQIANQIGGRPATLRVRLDRAVARILTELDDGEEKNAR